MTLGGNLLSPSYKRALVLGYGDTTLGFLRNDVCVAPERGDLETSR